MNNDPNAEVAIFIEAIQLPAVERAGFLVRACGGDEPLRRRVERLLKAHDRSGSILEEPPTKGLAGWQTETAVETVIGERAGDQIGRYKLLQQIGEGGWGVVFMAEQAEPVRRRVALKIVKPGMDTKSVIARFEVERQALALMDHPNIARVLDAGATGSGRPYFVMELVRGLKVTDYCDQMRLTTAERLELFAEICGAVQHAHQKGIIHRDIKPSNILISTSAEGKPLPKVIDFGIAKAATNQRLTDKTLFTAYEMLVGTPAYMSPEQADLTAAGVDTRTDIYSLGVLLYELLTGTTPFDTRELLKAGLDKVRRVIRSEEPARPSTRLSTMEEPELSELSGNRQVEPPKLIREVRGDLDWIVMKALEKDPARRYPTANGLAMDVQRYLAGEPVMARPPSAVYKVRKIVLRHKLLFAGAAAVVALLAGGLMFVSMLLAREHMALRNSERDRLKAQQSDQFLEEMLQGVGPSVALGRDTTMLREILDKTAARVGTKMTNQPEVEADLRSLMGRLYFQIGDAREAERMDRAAANIYEKLNGPESVEVAAALNQLGVTLEAEGKLPEAEKANERALEIRRRRFGNENLDTAMSLNNLGSVYRERGKTEQAEALIREGLAIREKINGSEDLEVADSLRNLSLVLGDEGKWADAEQMARQVLAMRQKLLGPEHPWVASALADVAWAAGGEGKLDEAEALERQALAMRLKLLGGGHPDVSKTLYLLGDRLRQRGRLDDAELILNATLSLQQQELGAMDPATLYTRRSLGLTLAAEGQRAEAEQMFREGLALWKKRGMGQVSEAIYVERNLGATLEAEGKLVEAERAYQEVYQHKSGGPEISDVENLSRVLIAEKKFGEAEKLLDEALTPEVVKRSSSEKLLVMQGDLKGRRGLWNEAAVDFAQVLQFRPQATDYYSLQAALLVKANNQEGYGQFCQQILEANADTTNFFVADEVAKACLLLNSPAVDLPTVSRLADMPVTLGTNVGWAVPYFNVCKALAEYRLGHYAAAAEWAGRTVSMPLNTAHQHAYAVLAMADWQLGQTNAAREMLAKGDALAPPTLPRELAESPGQDWVAWLFARVSLDEAEALIKPTQPDASASQTSNQPL